jgi:hypothetical protein
MRVVPNASVRPIYIAVHFHASNGIRTNGTNGRVEFKVSWVQQLVFHSTSTSVRVYCQDPLCPVTVSLALCLVTD